MTHNGHASTPKYIYDFTNYYLIHIIMILASLKDYYSITCVFINLYYCPLMSSRGYP